MKEDQMFRAEQLVSRYLKEMNQYKNSPFYDDPDLLIYWLLGLSESVKDVTFKGYRKLLAAYCAHIGESELSVRVASVGRGDAGRKSSNDKTRDSIVFTQSTLERLMKALCDTSKGDSDRYSYGALAAVWFTATMMTGVRPSEWYGAILSRDVKASNGVV